VAEIVISIITAAVLTE